MKVLLINGSPRSNGETYTVLKMIEETLQTLGKNMAEMLVK